MKKGHKMDASVIRMRHIRVTLAFGFFVYSHGIYIATRAFMYTLKVQRYGSCLDYNRNCLTVSKTTKALPLICPCGSDDRASVN
ncbi:hypothetical protein NYE70_23435 [Paenibacillus sp. FSL R5-0407]